MQFVHWYTLEEAEFHAPTREGVYQLRVAEGLIDYPTGKSAMIRYGAASNLKREVASLSARHQGENWLCRHAIDVGDPAEFLSTLLARFEKRFGCQPRLPA
jgi:hypothetical protein